MLPTHSLLMAKNNRIASLIAERDQFRAELSAARNTITSLQVQLEDTRADRRALDSMERILREQDTYEVFGYDAKNDEYHTQGSILVAATLRELLDLWVRYMDSSPFTISNNTKDN